MVTQTPVPFYTAQLLDSAEDDDNDDDEHTYSLETHAAIYWSVFIGIVVLLIGGLIIYYRCVATHYSDVRHRLTYYDYESLKSSKKSLVVHIYFYRHRPLVLEFIKVIWLVSISLCLLLGYSKEIQVFCLAIWCIVDILTLVCGIFYAIMERNIIRRRSQHATRMAKYFAAVYSFMFGVPVGTVTKVLYIFYLFDNVGFSLVFRVPAIYFAVTGGLMLMAGVILSTKPWCWCSICCTQTPTYKRWRIILLLLGLGCVVCSYLFGTLSECSKLSSPSNPGIVPGCSFFAQYWGGTLECITLPMLIASCTLSAKVISAGMVWRFFPELLSVWFVTLSAHVAAFEQDINPEGSGEGYHTYFVNQIVACEFIAVVVLIVYNVYTVTRTMSVWQAVRSQNNNNIAELLNLTNTERVMYFGASAQIQPIRRLNTLKKRVLQKLYDRMEKSNNTTIGAFLRNTLRENIKKYGDVNQCSICFEEYDGDPDKVELGVSKKCGHYFHFDCVWRWLETKPTCPLCRDSVTLERGDLKAIMYLHVQRATQDEIPVQTAPLATAEQDHVVVVDSDGEIEIIERESKSEEEEVQSGESVVEISEGEVESVHRDVESGEREDVSGERDVEEVENSEGRSQGRESESQGEKPISCEDEELHCEELKRVVSSSSSEGGAAVAMSVYNAGEASLDECSVHLHHSATTKDKETGTSVLWSKRKVTQTSDEGLKSVGSSKDFNIGIDNPGLDLTDESIGRPSDVNSKKSGQERDNFVGLSNVALDMSDECENTDGKPLSNHLVSEWLEKNANEREITVEGGSLESRRSNKTELPPEVSSPQAKCTGPRRKRRKSICDNLSIFLFCSVCESPYAGDATDIIVGFLPKCRHFFHYNCIQTEIEKHHTCPQCMQDAINEGDDDLPSTSQSSSTTPSRVSVDDIRFAFLTDVFLQKHASSDTQDRV